MAGEDKCSQWAVIFAMVLTKITTCKCRPVCGLHITLGTMCVSTSKFAIYVDDKVYFLFIII